MTEGEFMTPLDVRVVNGATYPGEYKLLAPLEYYSGILGQTVTIPTGFTTDFASIPQMFLSHIGFIGHDAAVVHDYLCRNWPLDKRETADTVFYEALLAMGVDPDKAYEMYQGVQLYTDHLIYRSRKDDSDLYIA